MHSIKPHASPWAGLNMLNQAREFNDTVKLTGLILTKLDGSARGGAVVRAWGGALIGCLRALLACPLAANASLCLCTA